MRSIKITGNGYHPFILFDIEKGIVQITGNCCGHDAHSHFRPLLSTLRKSGSITSKIHVQLFLSRVNLVSGSELIRVLKEFRKHQKSGTELSIIWYYEDEEQLELGQNLAELVGLGMVFKSLARQFYSSTA